MFYCRIHIRNNFGCNDHIKVLCAPIVLIGGHCALYFRQLSIRPDFDARINQRTHETLANRVGNSLVDQQTFGGPTNPSAACFGVHHNLQHFLGVGVFINIDMHNSFKVRKNRNTGFALNQTNKPFATAWYDHINLIHHRKHFRNCGAVTGWNQLDCILGQVCIV